MLAQNKEKAERSGSAAKLKKKKTAVKRSHTFNASYDNKTEKKSDSPKFGDSKKTTPSNSPFPEPKYTKAVYLLLEAKKLAREIEEKKKNGDLFRNKLRGSGRGHSFSRPGTPSFVDRPGSKLQEAKGRALQDASRRCDECGRGLTPGNYSQHQGEPFCNVPCYTMLFSSLKSTFNKEGGGSRDLEDGLSIEQKQFRKSVIPKLRTYNTYYADKPFQISCRECEGQFIMEGTLKVYWGLKKPVELKANDLSYWRNFHPVDDDESIQSNFPRRRKSTLRRKAVGTAENSFQAPTISSYQKQANNNDEFLCSRVVQRKSEQTTFTPPYGVPTTLRVSSNMKTCDVISMLLKKFQIINKPSLFSLCTFYEGGGIKKISSDASPLVQRLFLGPCEDVSKIFVMETASHQDVPHEIAQYCNFAMYELETFLAKFKEEEEREVEKLKERYKSYREDLQRRLVELQYASKITRV